jgi:pilus assembly protein Flp/PilA
MSSSSDFTTASAGEVVIMKNLIVRFVREEEGQDIIEYALLAAFISISGYTILSGIGTSVNSIYTKVNSATSSAQAAAPAGS